MAVIHVTKQDFEEVVLNAKEKVLVDFYAEWCGPCKRLAPLIEQIAEGYPDVKVCKVNIDEAAEIAIDYKVTMVPTLCLFENREITKQLIGEQSRSAIEDMLA